jgi:undecaprenyl-diphosphatase
MDINIFFFINQGLQNSFFDMIMPFITSNAYIFFFIVIIPVFLKDRKKTLLVTFLCLVALAIGDASANLLKHAIERPRPCQGLAGIESYREGVRLLVGCGGSFSMPSSHAVNAFSIAATFSYFFRRTAIPMFLIASLVAFSRVYVGVHYLSDVIAGALWGGLIAVIIIMIYRRSSERFKNRPYSTVFFLSLAALTLFRYYYISSGPLDLSPDEALYWGWSRRLDLSYYSKGPMVAYLIAASTWVMGDSVFGVRFLAPLFLAMTSIIIYRFSLEIYHEDRDAEKKASLAALLPQIIPLFATIGLLMTIDSPFIFLWTLSLFLFWRAVYSRTASTQPSTMLWILLGITVGLGLLTKYTMALFYVCALLSMIFSKEGAALLRRKEPYISFILSLLVFSPVVIWNLDYDWVTLYHTAGHLNIKEGFNISTKYFLDFLGSQAGVLTPLIFVLVIYGAVRGFLTDRSSSITRILFWFWAPLLCFFIIKSFQGKVQANWAAAVYVAAFIASAGYLTSMQRIGRTILLTALTLSLVVTAVAHYPSVLKLPAKVDPTSRLRGWKELGLAADRAYKEMTANGDREVFVFSDKYQVSGELAFYMSGKPDTYCVNLGRRMNQFDIWGGINDHVGHDAVYVRMGDWYFPEELEEAFDRYERERVMIREKGRTLRVYVIFRCYGFKGVPDKEFEGY